MFKILIVDDEEKIREVIKTYGEYNGHKVLEAVDGLDAIEKVKENDFDIIVMDIMMPKLDGFTAYKEIKKIKDIPVIMLSARSEEYDKLFGFEVGADDYVVKPFSPKELMARINVIVNRNRKGNVKRVLDVEGLHIDLDGRTVSIDGEKIDLTPKEYDLLVFMIKNKNVALTRNKLLSKVWGYEFYGDDRTVDTHIKMLRNSIKDYRKYIVTVRGVGYKFEEGPLQGNN
ncbi:DNA-binding response OmpR family regulator [Peptoniphilus koenoeneniae]|uniref:DNA-binding response OmpR family regulator n=1 Tax=Peptoniphilus koenoeneniae TaxID=507751 RepID=A0ABU0AUC0_9FIRM|nr:MULTISPECIES: response regulator transcription factor [Peptoniphilus]ERT60178.1 response regulator receiver domain protein [Peptoniphilus sp. BV3C26]MDQ0274386.1 DNA-binding response OmpR family regulator [Peptoniphilus koenoeneniae]